MSVRGAGALDRRIVIQRASQTRSALNEPIDTWTDHARVWAAVEDVSAAERYRAEGANAKLSTRFTIRWSSAVSDVNPLDRVVFDGRTYNITAVRNSGRRQWREIDAVAAAELET